MRPGFFRGFYKLLWFMIILSGIYLAVRCYTVLGGAQREGAFEKLFDRMEYELKELAVKQLLPGLCFPYESAGEASTGTEFLVKRAYDAWPLYGYIEKYLLFDTEYESQSTYERILALEAQDENPAGEEEQMELENLKAAGRAEEEVSGEPGEQEEGAQPQKEEALPASAGVVYSMEQLADFDFLLNTFYTVDKSTAVSGAVLNGETLLQKDMTLDETGEGPQILIYHTHSQEGFVDSEPGNLDTTIVGVGDYLTELLEQTYGYRVIHNREVFDMVNGQEDRNQAFTMAGERIGQVLEENPSVQVVIDLHRDGLDEGTRLVTEVNGKQTAQFMFFNGLSYSRKNGEISYLPNPYIEDNLAFTLQLQLKAAQYYPGVTRKIYLKTYRYNLHLCPKAMLVECGAQTNTLEEAKNAMEPLASILHMVLEGE